MTIEVTINNITGQTPYDIYICNSGVTTCIYVDTILSTPYVFDIPQSFSNLNSYSVKIVDSNNCVIFKNFNV